MANRKLGEYESHLVRACVRIARLKGNGVVLESIGSVGYYQYNHGKFDIRYFENGLPKRRLEVDYCGSRVFGAVENLTGRDEGDTLVIDFEEKRFTIKTDAVRGNWRDEFRELYLGLF